MNMGIMAVNSCSISVKDELVCQYHKKFQEEYVDPNISKQDQEISPKLACSIIFPNKV